jgi:hypothetical protein
VGIVTDPLRKPYTFRLPPDLIAEVDAAADAAGTNRTRWLEQAARDRLAGRTTPTTSRAGWQGSQQRRSIPTPGTLSDVQPRWKGGR